MIFSAEDTQSILIKGLNEYLGPEVSVDRLLFKMSDIDRTKFFADFNNEFNIAFDELVTDLILEYADRLTG